MFWLSPASEKTDPFSPVLRYWQSAVPIRADILPGMHFFNAWQIFPTMQIESGDHEDLDSFDGVLPSREKLEFRAQTNARTVCIEGSIKISYREIEMFHLPSDSIALITKLNVCKVANGTTTGSKQISVLGFAVEVVDKQGDDSPFLIIEDSKKKGVDTCSYSC